jgi:hypothetical protein
METQERDVFGGQLYRHYKGTLYEVLFVARHSESGRQMVAYRKHNTSEQPWTLSLYNFNETVFINGNQVRRFERIVPQLFKDGVAIELLEGYGNDDNAIISPGRL